MANPCTFQVFHCPSAGCPLYLLLTLHPMPRICKHAISLLIDCIPMHTRVLSRSVGTSVSKEPSQPYRTVQEAVGACQELSLQTTQYRHHESQQQGHSELWNSLRSRSNDSHHPWNVHLSVRSLPCRHKPGSLKLLQPHGPTSLPCRTSLVRWQPALWVRDQGWIATPTLVGYSYRASIGVPSSIILRMLHLLQVVLFTHGGCEAAWGCSPVRASTAGHEETGHALHAMMRCIATECPQISWRARDASLADVAPDVIKYSMGTAAELTHRANATAVPLLVACARSIPDHNLHEMVCFSPDSSPQYH